MILLVKCSLLWTLEDIPGGTAPPASAALPLTVDSTPSAPQNYFDCTESNGEDDDDEEEGKGDAKTEQESQQGGPSETPRWEDFFSAGTLTDSQNSQSGPCCSATSPSPSDATGSQTPELFSDGEEAPNKDFNLTLSASTSAHSSQNLDSLLPDTVILRPEQAVAHHSVADQSEQAELSQASSDFDIPSTPESKAPQPEELSQLYRKLASAEEVVVGKGSV